MFRKNQRPVFKMSEEDYNKYVLSTVMKILVDNTNKKIKNISEVKSRFPNGIFGQFYIEINKDNFQYNEKYFGDTEPLIPMSFMKHEDKDYFMFSPRFNGYGEAMCLLIDMNDKTEIINKIEFNIPKVAKPLTAQVQRLDFRKKEPTFSGMSLAVKYKGEYRKLVVLTESDNKENLFYCLKEKIYTSEQELLENYNKEVFKTLYNYPETRYLKALDLNYICKNVYEMPFGKR